MPKCEFLGVRQGVLIQNPIDRQYFAGIDIEDSYVLLCENPAYFVDARCFYAVKNSIEERGFSPVLFKGLESIKTYLKTQKITTLFIDYRHTTLTDYKLFKSLKVRLKDGSEQIENCRQVKTQTELDKIQKACEITQNAFYTLVKEIKEGVTERQLADRLNALYKSMGSSGESFDTIVAFGANSAIPPHKTGDTKLQKGMPILIDTGCVFDGYLSDFTRTMFYGEPTKKFVDAYDSTLKANLKAIDGIQEGMKTNECDEIARQVLTSYGYGEKFTHSLGHGIGLEIHEPPTLSPKKSTVMQNGMVFTIEPGVYFDGEFGIRIEDTVVLKDGKVERLFTDDKNLIIL